MCFHFKNIAKESFSGFGVPYNNPLPKRVESMLFSFLCFLKRSFLSLAREVFYPSLERAREALGYGCTAKSMFLDRSQVKKTQQPSKTHAMFELITYTSCFIAD